MRAHLAIEHKRACRITSRAARSAALLGALVTISIAVNGIITLATCSGS